MTICAVEGCDHATKGRRICETHHKRLVKHGDLLADLPIRRKFSGPASERFWHYVEKVESGCWLWTGALHKGYGTFMDDDQKMVRAHRWAYEHLVASIPDGLVIDHLCEVPACVNPEHMEVVTDEVNILRGSSLAAQNYRKTHCKRGHPLSGDNLVREPKQRKCRICKNENQRKNYALRKARRAAA